MKPTLLLGIALLSGCGSSSAEGPSPSSPGDAGAADSPTAPDSALNDAPGSADVAHITDSMPASDAMHVADSPAGSDASSGCAVTIPDPHAAQRSACAFAAGARTLDTLGITPAVRATIPIKHVIVVTEENRSFDHFFGKLPQFGQPDADGLPASFANPDLTNMSVASYHLTSGCLPNDPPHQGAAMQEDWDQGKMDGFVVSAAQAGEGDGHFAMGYYDGTDLPFLYWLANTYSIADHYFGSVLGGTWGNRDYLYAATSDGVTDTGQATLSAPTIFDALDAAHVSWGVYSDGSPRQDCLGWMSNPPHPGFSNYTVSFLMALAAGTLPAVSFVDPTNTYTPPIITQDEHPTAEIHGGEAWMAQIYDAALKSPLWDQLAIVFTFDEAGGLADHSPPPSACPPSADQAAFNQLGIRIPTIVVSPWARLHTVSHVVHDHTSVLRFIETLFDLPALTARDANADALLDMFDFGCPARTNIPTAAAAGTGTCP
jgi:phospholipase C